CARFIHALCGGGSRHRVCHHYVSCPLAERLFLELRRLGVSSVLGPDSLCHRAARRGTLFARPQARLGIVEMQPELSVSEIRGRHPPFPSLNAGYRATGQPSPPPASLAWSGATFRPRAERESLREERQTA